MVLNVLLQVEHNKIVKLHKFSIGIVSHSPTVLSVTAFYFTAYQKHLAYTITVRYFTNNNLLVTW